MDFLSPSHTKRKKEVNQKYNLSITSKNPGKSSQIATNFYVFYHLCSDPDENIKNENQCKILMLLLLLQLRYTITAPHESFYFAV